MKTYQDLQLVTAKERTADIIDFVKQVINDHKGSERYDIALTATEYDRGRNTTIVEYQKLLYTVRGEVVPDNYSANYKLCSNYFDRFITQENQFLLGNGITWTKEDTATRLGDKFDTAIQKAGMAALIGGVSFGLWNLDHVDVFNVLEFAPLFDEEDGALKAGVRFWQIAPGKPLRATLYEMDGYTDFIWNKRDDKGDKNSAGEVLHEKRPYKLKIRKSEADGEQIYDGENYPAFPIVPLYANDHKQSELVGRREQIDAYDLIKSGFANDIDDASQIYWTLQNAGGMDDMDLVKFVEHMKTVKAAVVTDNAKAESHTIEVPFESREAVLNRLRTDLYDDFMALNTKEIVGGATTATQIIAAYDPLQKKTDKYEYQVREFIGGLLNVAGIDDVPTFTRDIIINTTEEIQALMQSATYLSADYVTEKVLTLLGDKDKVPEVMREMQEDDIDRLPVTNNQEGENEDEQNTGLQE